LKAHNDLLQIAERGWQIELANQWAQSNLQSALCNLKCDVSVGWDATSVMTALGTLVFTSMVEDGP
jgi:hypothetical protein